MAWNDFKSVATTFCACLPLQTQSRAVWALRTVRRRENSCTRCGYIKTKRLWKILYILCRHCHALHTFLVHVDRSELTVTYPLPYPIENLFGDRQMRRHATHQISAAVQRSHSPLFLLPMGKPTLCTPKQVFHVSH